MKRLWIGSKAPAALRRSALLLAVCWTVASCSAVVDTDKAKLGPVPVPCEPGQIAPCPCRDGSMSTQKCNVMARFDGCACGGSAGRAGRAGTDAASAGRAASTSTRSR